jgi:hypothetical protein
MFNTLTEPRLNQNPTNTTLFGASQLKSNKKFNKFICTSLEKVELDFSLMAISHNLRKLIAKSMQSGLKSSKKPSLGYKSYISLPVLYVPEENSNHGSLIMPLMFQYQKIAA